jgi:regulator of protease activity HflC (stomatin/prohibitin superfamily)
VGYNVSPSYSINASKTRQLKRPPSGEAGEKQARIILGSAEAEVASRFVDAARAYAEYPIALQLRAMNIIYETTKERGSTILIPTSMVDTMNPASALVPAGPGRSES